jgi:hypothetical protein
MFEGIDDKITGFVGAAKVNVQLSTVLIHNATRYIFFLAAHIMITRLDIASGFSTS